MDREKKSIYIRLNRFQKNRINIQNKYNKDFKMNFKPSEQLSLLELLVKKYQPNNAFFLKTQKTNFFLLKFYLCLIQKHRLAGILKLPNSGKR